MKAKALRSFSAVTGHVAFGDVFELPDSIANDYVLAGLIEEVKQSEAAKPALQPEKQGYKTMKTKRK